MKVMKLLWFNPPKNIFESPMWIQYLMDMYKPLNYWREKLTDSVKVLI